jgi:aarF domain-containing kinase
VYAGNFLVSKEPPFKPILVDFGLTKSLPFSKKQALAKMLLACAKVSGLIFLNLQ